MNDNLSQRHRAKREVIADLERLCQEDGFIYSYCGLVLSSLFMSPKEIAETDWTQRLNTQELAFLLGLMVKRPLSLTVPSSPARSDAQYNSVIRLFEELHKTHGFPFKIPATENQQNLEESIAKHVQAYDDWMDNGLGMVEPIFYGGEGAYDFQYFEMAEKRYRDDSKWLAHYLGIGYDVIIEIARQLTRLSLTRVNNFHVRVSSEDFFLQYLETFSFGPKDISGIAAGAIDRFLQAFSLAPGEVNQSFDTVGGYNRVHSHPVIRMENDRLFLPLTCPRCLYHPLC